MKARIASLTIRPAAVTPFPAGAERRLGEAHAGARSTGGRTEPRGEPTGRSARALPGGPTEAARSHRCSGGFLETILRHDLPIPIGPIVTGPPRARVEMLCSACCPVTGA